MNDRTAILTGVTGGWGRAVLDRFLSQGWNVCATSREHTDQLPGAVLVVPADLTDPAAAEHVVAACLERFGGVQALACVAGGFKKSGRCTSRRRMTGTASWPPTWTPRTR